MRSSFEFYVYYIAVLKVLLLGHVFHRNQRVILRVHSQKRDLDILNPLSVGLVGIIVINGLVTEDSPRKVEVMIP